MPIFDPNVFDAAVFDAFPRTDADGGGLAEEQLGGGSLDVVILGLTGGGVIEEELGGGPIVIVALSGGGVAEEQLGGDTIVAVIQVLTGTGIAEEALGAGLIDYGIEPSRSRVFTVQNLLRGKYGPPVHTYDLWVSDKNASRIKKLKVKEGGEVRFSNTADASWELSVTIKSENNFNPSNDLVLVTDTVSAGGYSEQFPMGLYVFDDLQGQIWESHSEWDLTGYSLERVLSQDMPEVYFAPKNSNVLTLVSNIITAQGFPLTSIDFPLTPNAVKLLPKDFLVTVVDSGDSAWWLVICNTLLKAAGFNQLTTTAEGKFYTRLVIDYFTRAADLTYGPSSGAYGMLIPPLQLTADMEAFGNRVLVMSKDTQDTPPLFAVAENHNPNSAASIERYGRRRTVPPISLDTVMDLATIQAWASIYIQLHSSYFQKLSLTTFPDPRCGPGQIYAIQGIPDGETHQEVVNGNYIVAGWSQSLDSPRSAMTHDCSKLVLV